MNFWAYFTDPILRAPTWGCLFLCVTASLMGVILLMQRRMLLAELISHTAYPGAIGALLGLACLGSQWEAYSFFGVLGGALISSWVGLRTIACLERKWKVSSDAALCFVLSVFFGIGVLLTSWLQGVYPMWVGQAKMLLFGQAATLTDEHVFAYGLLTAAAISFLFTAFRPLQAFLFDRQFIKSVGLRTKGLQKVLLALLLLSIVIGIRSVGVVLISGMLIAPAVAARQWTHRLKTMFWLAALFGAVSGFLGHLISVELAVRSSIYLPTGPSIVLVGTAIALVSLLLAPQRGVLFRAFRLAHFRFRCLEENVLKGLWSRGGMKREDLERRYPMMLSLVLLRLIREGWAVRQGEMVHLTEEGFDKASTIVRLHRLWELYLTEQLGLQAERVHHSAEEMEHILTPELEQRLTHLLSNPEKDPHQQPIPQRRTPR
ncbi:MAG: metal ABC transporter permease [Verrucomicrobiota bacterium]|nr:metal ABC transporter permease [Verrucomicrobiota bacterium]